MLPGGRIHRVKALLGGSKSESGYHDNPARSVGLNGEFRFRSLERLVDQNQEVPTSGKDIEKICDGKVFIVTYSEIRTVYENGGDIIELFQPDYNDCVVLLYELKGPQGVGHWVSLIFDREKRIIRFFNSYGLNVDAEINTLTHGDPYLTMLLKRSGLKMDINKHRYQSFKDDIATCGLHCAVRCVFHDLTNEEYFRFLSSYFHGQKDKDFDELVTLMCLLPLKYNITKKPLA